MDVVTRLREGELRSLRLQAENGLRDNAVKGIHERGEGQELVRQQYTGRYPFELLQNANDAARDARTRGRVHFLLTETALIVADNGFGFGDEQVAAICSLGQSSKGPGEAVGHKGLGFKSVGEITDHPQITSARASFQFSSDRVRAEVSAILGPLRDGQKLPVYAFPFPVETSDVGPDAEQVADLCDNGFTTVIRLPFNEGVDRAAVERHLLDNLHPRLLIFLPDVDHLELRGTSGDFSADVVRARDAGAEHALLDTDGTSEEWLIYRGSVVPDDAVLAPLGDAWKGVKEAEFAVAVLLNDDGGPQVSETFPLHVYFPTDEEPGLRVAVHAEWVLTMDRRQIAATPEALAFNRMLIHALGDFVSATVAHDLVERMDASASAIEALVPAAVAPYGPGGTRVRARWTQALSAASFLPAADGSLRPPSELRPLPHSLPDPQRAHQVARLDLAHSLRPDIEVRTAVRAFLSGVPGIDEIGMPEFLSLMSAPTRDTAHDYYSFLVSWRESAGMHLLTELKKTPSVLGVNGQLFTPSADTIFFPRERGDVALPEDLPIPVAYAPPDFDDAQSLLRELGVKPFEWRELIRDFLIKLLESDATDELDRSRAMDGLRTYHKARLSGSEGLEPVLGRVLVPARTADGETTALRRADRSYFSAPWTGSDDLEIIYGPSGEPEFLDVELPEDSEQRETDLDFYRMLGVADHPRLDEAKPAEKGGYMLGGLRHKHRGRLFDEWMRRPEVQRAAKCPQGHPASQQLRLSFRLDRHEELIESRDPVRLMALWKQLARRWGAAYEDGMHAQFWCTNTSHSGDRGRLAPSLFAYTLDSRPWVPVDRGNVAVLVRPRNAWVGAAQTPRRIQQRIPRISEAMYQTQGGAGLAAALHLTDAGRPRVADLLALLGSIAEEADAGGTNREIDQAARWVQRTLHEVLREEEEPHPAPQTIRLLASQNGVTSFVAAPPYAEDPLLRDTFEQQRPLLSAESGLTKLTRYLSLTKLDGAVKTSAMPLGEHHDSLFDDVAKRIHAIKPYLLALVRAENSSAENRVRPALRTLELVVCEQLVLRYEYDGTVVTRDDAVCYIASRPEQRGRRHVGTAYLELDPETLQPHWFPLGRQLAQFLNVPTLSDALTMLLTATPGDRKRMMADRQIQDRDIAEAGKLLRISPEEDEELSNVLDSLVPEPGDEDQREPAPVAARNQAAAASVTAQNAESGDDEQAEPPAAGKPSAPPSIDYSSVEIVDARPGQLAAAAPTRQPSHRTGAAGSSKAPSIQTEEENRRVGKRGEEVAYNAERRRLEALGKNADSVHWISRTDELSSYDLISVDDDDQLIYIEVKATKGSDPTEPFYISHAELIEASFRRSRFYIYRVTDVDSAVPAITRWADPLALIKEGKGQLLLAKAQMALTLGDEPEGTASAG